MPKAKLSRFKPTKRPVMIQEHVVTPNRKQQTMVDAFGRAVQREANSKPKPLAPGLEYAINQAWFNILSGNSKRRR